MDPSLVTLLAAAAGLVLLFAGGDLLVRGAAALAVRLGISPMTVGLTVVAFGTSTPELVVSLDSALSGAGDIALANVVGSNIANIALILGLAALLRPVRAEAEILRWDGPVVVVASLLLIGLLVDGTLSRWDGGLLLAGLVAYVVSSFRRAQGESAVVQEEFAAAAPATSFRTAVDILFVPLGLAALVGGGHLLVGAAVELAESLGVGQAFIGLTIVALGTSLPELATSAVASVKGQGDIAIGNVVGSNLFNILGILGATALLDPLARGGIDWPDLLVMLGLAVVLLPLMRTGMRLSRLEGAALLACYVGFVAWLVVSSVPS